MASRRRTINRQLPAYLSEPLNRLYDAGKLFIELYDVNKGKMQAIATEIMQISKKTTEIQRDTNTDRMIGVALGGLGVLALGAAVYLGGAGKMTVLGGAAIGGGATSVIKANVTKAATEKEILKTVEQLGKDFMEITGLQNVMLVRIKEVSEEFEEKSATFMKRTAAQAENGLLRTQELQKLLTQTAKLAEMSEAAMNVTEISQKLLNFIISIIQITPSSEDVKLKNYITDSALQCEKTVNEFAKMRHTLKEVEQM